MTIDNQMLGQSLVHGTREQSAQNLGQDSTCAIDFAFLVAQTFADTMLERDLLVLFVAQARKILPTLPSLTEQARRDTAHLLKGSARAIGAWSAAAAADDYESASPEDRDLALPKLMQAFEAVETAIEARLEAL